MSSVPFIPKSIDDINAILVTISSSLSLFGCLFILCIYIYYKELREFQLKLIFIMTINDLIISIIFLIATHVRPKFFDTLTDTFTFLCNFPDSILHYLFLASFFWEVCIAHTLIQVIKYNNERVEENYKKYHIFSWGLSAIIVIALFCLRSYRKTNCHSDSIFPHLLFFIPMLLTWIYNMVVCILLAKTFKDQSMNFVDNTAMNANSIYYINFNNNNSIDNSNIIINNAVINNDIINSSNDQLQPLSLQQQQSHQSSSPNSNNNCNNNNKTPNIVWTSIFFLFSFGFIWSWSLLVIILKYLQMDITYVLMASYFFIPLQGFMNSLCYGINDRLRANLKKSGKKAIYKIKKLLHLDQIHTKKSMEESQLLFDYEREDEDIGDDYHYPVPEQPILIN